jgi:N-ethylmaleimide reductase
LSCGSRDHRQLLVRARFLFEVLGVVGTVWRGDRIGVRLSPWGAFLDCSDSDDAMLYTYVCEQLGKRDLAYLSVVEREWLGEMTPERDATTPPLDHGVRARPLPR